MWLSILTAVFERRRETEALEEQQAAVTRHKEQLQSVETKLEQVLSAESHSSQTSHIQHRHPIDKKFFF